jgi:hypothetical protein
MTKNDQKIAYKIYISATSSSSPGFIYLRESQRLQGKKDVMSSKSGPCFLPSLLSYNFYGSERGVK